MDIRIARTDRAIEQAFMELREKNPLERIKIKDLCALACINKSTFYAHYEDIYALANALENKLVESILASVPHTHDDEALHQTDALTRELFQAFVQNQRAVNILFSGNRQGIFANSIEKGQLSDRILIAYNKKIQSPENSVSLSEEEIGLLMAGGKLSEH